MSKTNGCLVARMCLKHFFGHGDICQACDFAHADSFCETFLHAQLTTLQGCIPLYLRKKYELAVKEGVMYAKER